MSVITRGNTRKVGKVAGPQRPRRKFAEAPDRGAQSEAPEIVYREAPDAGEARDDRTESHGRCQS